MSGAGKYRTPASIERVRADAEKGRDGKVNVNDDGNWELYCARHVEEQQLGGKEALIAQQVMADVSGLYRLRDDPITQGITPKMRLRVDGRTLNIVRAVRVGYPIREIELQCMEAVS